MITTVHSMRLIWIYSRVLLIVMGALLILSTGCSDEPECLFAPLPQCFSDGDSTEDETENTVNEEADAIDTSVLEIRDLITGIEAAIQTTVTGHLNDIEISTTEMRDEVENRTDGFRPHRHRLVPIMPQLRVGLGASVRV